MKIQSLLILILVALSVMTVIIITALIFIGFQISHELRKRRKIQEVVVYADMLRNTSNIYELLDSYINEKLTEYKIFNPDMFERALNNTTQTELSRDLTVDVLDTISPAFYSQLTLIFNPDPIKIQKLINNRVVMAVIALSLELQSENIENIL